MQPCRDERSSLAEVRGAVLQGREAQRCWDASALDSADMPVRLYGVQQHIS
jgi:hypothetical protein